MKIFNPENYRGADAPSDIKILFDTPLAQALNMFIECPIVSSNEGLFKTQFRGSVRISIDNFKIAVPIKSLPDLKL